MPASCCLTNTACVINNRTVVESVWPDDCYHKASLQKCTNKGMLILQQFQGVEFLQEHSAVMGSVTLAAAVTMVRGVRGQMSGTQTMGAQMPCMDNTKDEISQF